VIRKVLDFLESEPLVIAALLLTGIVSSMVVVSPNDFWVHLKVGSVIAQQRVIPESNMFTWGVAFDAPFFYAAWFGDLLFFILFAAGGVELIIFGRNLLAVLTFVVIAREARQRVGSWKYVGLAIAVAGMLMVPIAAVRPQIWAWLPFVTTMALLAQFKRGQLRARWLTLLPVIMVFWVNVHGSYALGLILLGIYWLGNLGSQLLSPPVRRNWHVVRQLTAVGAATGLAALVNPLGIAIVPYVIRLITLPAGRLVDEWLSPQLSHPYGLMFYATSLLLVLVIATACVRKRAWPDLTDTLLLIVFFILGTRGYRYIFWFGLVAAPILVGHLSGMVPKLDVAVTHGRWRRIIPVAVCAFFSAGLLLVQPWTVQRIPLPEVLLNRTLPPPAPPLITIGTPMAAAEYLRAHPGGKLMAEMGQASYLIWSLPEQPAFVDTRVEMYPFEIWQDYLYISAAIDYQARLDKYGIDRLLVSPVFQWPLAGALRKSDAWEAEYLDPFSEVWKRRQVPQPEAPR
jgi:hypothetical protein